LGTPFSQDIKISPSGYSNPGGVNLKLELFQNGIKKNINELMSLMTVLMVVDNMTGNLVNPFELYIDGIKQNSSIIDLKSDKLYNLRITANGYNDLVVNNLSVTQSKLQLNINPDKNEYSVGEIINITSQVENISITANNIQITNPYTINSVGNITIIISKSGYESTNRTILVKQGLYIGICTPIKTEWDKGDSVICPISENTEWTVNFNGVQIATGNGNKIEFKINDYGNVEIYANGKIIDSAVISKNPKWYTPWLWNKDYIKSHWIVVLILIVVIFGISYVFIKNKKSKETLSYS
jgi:hypothetical protein